MKRVQAGRELPRMALSSVLPAVLTAVIPEGVR
jgi:hypothetical protein